MYIWLVYLPPVQGGGFSPLYQLIPIIIPVTYFPRQKVSCSCCIYICSSHTALFFIYPQLSIFMTRSVAYMNSILLFFKKLSEFIQKTFCVTCMFPVCPSVMHSWVLWDTLLVMFGSLQASTYEPNTTMMCFWSPYVVLSLFTLGRTYGRSL